MSGWSKRDKMHFLWNGKSHFWTLWYTSCCWCVTLGESLLKVYTHSFNFLFFPSFLVDLQCWFDGIDYARCTFIIYWRNRCCIEINDAYVVNWSACEPDYNLEVLYTEGEKKSTWLTKQEEESACLRTLCVKGILSTSRIRVFSLQDSFNSYCRETTNSVHKA